MHLSTLHSHALCTRYKLAGDRQLKCTSSSKYDTVIPTCEEVTCPHPAVAQHMRTTTYPDPAATDGKYRPYTEIEYECEDGKSCGVNTVLLLVGLCHVV